MVPIYPVGAPQQNGSPRSQFGPIPNPMGSLAPLNFARRITGRDERTLGRGPYVVRPAAREGSSVAWFRIRRSTMSKYTLPKLRYPYDALEPYISRRILELHHDEHHAAYVKNANQALADLEQAREGGDLSRLASLERALAFNLGGHILHSIFWQNMMPNGGGKPDGEL